MNWIRRYTLHRWNSRHNPLTKAALIFILSALAMAALAVVSEWLELRIVTAADKRMIAELTQFAEGKAKLVEVTGRYAIERSVQSKTYENTAAMYQGNSQYALALNETTKEK